MKRKLTSLLLVLCMLLPLLPALPFGVLAATAVGAANATDFVKNKTYDFGDVPAYSWYTIKDQNYDYENDGFVKNTGYNDYIAKFNSLFEENVTYADMEQTDTVTFLGGYVTRENLGASSVYDAEKFNSGANNRTDLGTNSPAYSDDPNADPRDWLGGKHVFSYTIDPRKKEGYTGSQNIPKLIIVAGTQADEKSSCFALYYIIQELLTRTDDPQINYLRDNTVMIIIPALTPYNMDNYTYWNANGVNINRNYSTFWKHVNNTTAQTQYGGEEPFDQAEAQMMKKIIDENRDAFYLADCHTCTSGNLPAGDYEHLNWHAVPKSYDSYISRLEAAAETQIANLRENFKRFPYCDYTDEDKVGLITYTTTATTPSYAISQGILATTMEGFCGFPGAGAAGLYAPEVKEAYIETLVNWLMTVVREYATEKVESTDTVTSSFYPMGENYPTITNLPIDFLGHYDTAGLDNTSYKSYLSSSTDYAIVYNGGWQMGYLPTSLTTTEADGTVTAVNKTWGDFVKYDRIVTMAGTTKPTLFIAGNNSPYTGKSAMQMGVDYTWLSAFQGIGTTCEYFADPAIRYTAEYSGKINIDISDLTFTSETGVLLVLKNGEEIGRVEATPASSTYAIVNGVWVAGDTEPRKMEKTITISVEAGETIDFVYDADARVLYPELWGNIVGESSAIDSSKSSNTNTMMSDRIKYGITRYRFDISYVRNTETVNSSYAGQTTDSAITVSRPTTMMPFFTWYKADGTAFTANNSTAISTASYAEINQDLIKAGYISADASYAEALEQYKNYLREIATAVDITSDWRVGAMESETASTTTGTKFSTINKYAFLSQSNIYLGTGSSKYSKNVSDAHWYVSANYFEYQLNLYCLEDKLPVPTEGTTASDFKIPYDATMSSAATVPHPSATGSIPAGSCRPVADTGTGCEGIMLCPHNSGKKAAVAYVVPAGVAGEATLQVTEFFFAPSKTDSSTGVVTTYDKAFQWALIVNGEIKVNYTPYNPATDTIDDINNVLKENAVTVKGGDTVAFAITRTSAGAIWVSPALSITIDQTSAQVYTGTSSEVTVNRPTSMIPFFTWYNESGAIEAGESLSSATYATINQALITNGILTGEEDYATALTKYKNYLRNLAKAITANGDWMVGAMEGDTSVTVGANFNHINSYAFLSQSNIYLGVGSSTYSSSIGSGQLYVTENYFDFQLNTYCQGDALMQPTSGSSADDYVFETPYSSLTVTNVTHPTGAGSVMPAAMVRQPNETGNYEGILLAPHTTGSNKTGAIAYRVPTDMGGTVTLTVNSLYFGTSSKGTYCNGPFQWALYLNDQVIVDFGDVYTDGTDTLSKINDVLAANSIQVSEGDLIQFAIREQNTSLWISPSLTLTGLSETAGLRRVQFVQNGNVLVNTFAPVGSNLADVLTLAKLDSAITGKNGSTVNGVPYAADATLPVVGDTDVVVVDGMTAASLTIDDAYAMNIYLPQDAAATAAGVLVNGEKLAAVKQSDNRWKVSLGTIVAKDILSSTFTYTPYTTYAGGDLASPAAVTVATADLLNAYLTNEDETVVALAQATIDYAEAAEAYFANDPMTEETKTNLKASDGDLAALAATKSHTPADEDFKFFAATVALGDRVNFVLAVVPNNESATLADLENCKVTVSDTSFDGFISTSVEGTPAMIILVEGVAAVNISETLTFTVVDADGNAVSAPLTYSVSAYCARNFVENGETLENYLIRAIYRLGVAADAHENAQ